MNRTSYYGCRTYRWLIGGMLAIFVGLFVWMFYSALFDSTAHPSDRKAAVWGCLIFPAVSYFLGWVLREVSAVYTVDLHGIEKRVLGRSHRLEWDDVVQFN